MLEFFDKNVIKKAVIYGGTYYYDKHLKTHMDLLEKILGMEFSTNDLYEKFIKKTNPIFLYFFPNDYIVFSSFEKVSLFKLLEILEAEGIPVDNLYRQHEFDSLIDYSTFSKINTITFSNNGDSR